MKEQDYSDVVALCFLAIRDTHWTPGGNNTIIDGETLYHASLTVTELLSIIREGANLPSTAKEQALKCARECMKRGRYYDAQKWFEISGLSHKEATIRAADGFVSEGLAYRGRAMLSSAGFYKEAEKL